MRVEPVRQALDYGERPDPAAGIFETILTADGRARRLRAHYERLSASALALYGVDLAPELAQHAIGFSRAPGRLRVTHVPGRPLTFEAGMWPTDPHYTGLAPFVLPGGLGVHKWSDRGLIDGLEQAAGAGTLPVLIDDDSAVLETTWANVLIEEGGRLISPPDDGRARPGIGRSRLQYDEEPVDLDRLLAADAVVLTSALRVLRLPLTS
jgi:para-aminobenzoate synthetase/4-amino-4-deoxychorismate lyase